MKSPVITRPIFVKGRVLYVGLEREYWLMLEYYAQMEGKTCKKVVWEVDEQRLKGGFFGLSSALRMYVLRKLTVDHPMSKKLWEETPQPVRRGRPPRNTSLTTT